MKCYRDLYPVKSKEFLENEEKEKSTVHFEEEVETEDVE